MICFFSFHCDVGFWRAKHQLLRYYKFRDYLLIKQSLLVISTDIRSLFEEYLRLPGRRFGIIKPLILDQKSPACLKEPRLVFVPRWFKSTVNLAIEEQVSQVVESRNDSSSKTKHPSRTQGSFAKLRHVSVLEIGTAFQTLIIFLKWAALTRILLQKFLGYPIIIFHT